MMSAPMPRTSSSATRDREGRASCRRDAGVLELLEEGDVAVAVQRVEDDVRVGRLDLADDRGVVGVAERGVLLAGQLAALRLELRLDDVVGRAREDVVGAEQEQLLLASS